MASPGDDLTKIFKKPLPKNPTLIESLSPAYHIRPPASSVTPPVEVLGEELSYFTKNPEEPLANPPPQSQASSDQSTHDHNNKKGGIGEDNPHPHGIVPKIVKKSRSFPPPPISSIGKSGKPCVYLKAYRKDGMLVLREVRSPWQKFLQTTREDGRLRMQLIHTDDEEDVAGGRDDDDDDGQEEGQQVQEQERQEEFQDDSKCSEEDEKKQTGNDDSDSHQTQQTHV